MAEQNGGSLCRIGRISFGINKVIFYSRYEGLLKKKTLVNKLATAHKITRFADDEGW